MDSGCSNSIAFAAPCSEGLCAEGICITTGGRCDQTVCKPSTIKVRGDALVVRRFLLGEKNLALKVLFIHFFVGRKGNHDRRHVPGAGASPT